MIAGVVYIPVSLYLRVLTARTDAIGPRRAFVLALLAGGIIAGAIGAATALFAFGSQALGAPISNWEDVTRVGVAIFLVGLAIAGIYFWSARSEHLLQARPSAAPAPTAEGAPQPAAKHRANPRRLRCGAAQPRRGGEPHTRRCADLNTE